MPIAKISSKHQIVVPKEAREALGVKAGDRVMVVTRGATVLLMREPESHATALRGLRHGVFGEGYLAKERESWKKK